MFGWFICLSYLGVAQVSDSLKTLRDTITLNEINISANLPLNDNDVVDFYRTNHFATLDNITARLDGMSLIKRGAYALEPQLNGFSGGQLNVTIDGMKMFGACTDKMDPITSYIEPTNLKNISIKQGTNGCQNGCNIGGSVDMTLQEPYNMNNKPFYSSLGFGYESISKSKNVLFSTAYIKHKWSFAFDGVYRKNENYKTGENRIVPFSQFQKTNIHSVVKFQPDSINSFKFDFLFDNATNVGYPALPMDVGVAKATLFALEYKHISKIQIKAKMYVNTIVHVMDDSKRDSLYTLKNKPEGKSDTVFMRMDMPGKSSTLGAYFQVTVPLNSKNKLILKTDNYTNNSVAEMTMHMRYAGFSPEQPMYMQTWPKMLRNVTGLFIQNTSFVSPNLMLLINGRIDYNMDILQSDYGQQQFSVFNYSLPQKQDKFIKSVNLSTDYRLQKSISIITTLGFSERMPNIGERLGFYLYNAYDGYDYIGNPYLNHEKSKFLRLDLQLSKSKLKINLSQSLSFVSDYIIGKTDTLIPAMNFYAKGIRKYTNLPSAKLYSTDLQVLYNPLNNLSVFLLSKFTYGAINSDIPLPLISPFKNILAVQYKKDLFSLQVECETSTAQNRINKDYAEFKTPAYTIFNIKSGYTFAVSKTTIDLSFGITNLLNKAYYEHLDWGRIFRPGRSIELFCKVSI